MLRRYLALWPSEVGRAYRLLELSVRGVLVMVLCIFLLPVLLRWVSVGPSCTGLVSVLSNLLVPFSAILDASGGEVGC